jgi:hypothetical protein
MSARRCFYADPSKRGSRSPDCAPGTFATHIVRRYFLVPRVAPLYLCRAHAEHHAHLYPREILRTTKGGQS